MEKKTRLSGAHLALLRKKLREQTSKAGIQQITATKTDANDIPLSFGQERFWLLQQFDPESGTYNRPCHMRFYGQLDTAALEKSLNRIVKRHSLLRTRFLMTGKHLSQVINAHENIALPIVELKDGTDATERERQAQALALAETIRPFDLATGPIIRYKLLRLAPKDHRLLLTIHHIAFDGWSEGLLNQELASLYQVFSVGEASTLEKFPIDYADFAIWQRHTLTDERLNEHIVYWKKLLRHENLVLDLPTDYPRPALQTSRGTRHVTRLNNDLVRKLKILGREENATLFMTLLAAFQILLYRYSGQERIIVGSPLAGRDRPETECLIGYFANTLPFLTDLSGNPSFRQQLRHVHDACLEVYQHQYLPFERLVDLLDVERDLSRSPLIQVFFQLRNYPRQIVDLPNLIVEPWEVDGGFEQFDLYLDVQEDTDGLRCVFRYKSDLFDQSTIIRMASHYKHLLEEILAGPDQPIASLSLLDRQERRQLLVGCNNTTTDYPSNASLGKLWEKQGECCAATIAVTCGNHSLTYAELEQRANQVANYLHTLGVGPDKPVGICMQRSLDMIVGLLGILKAGGAYVPLDPDFPNQRLTYMLVDSQAHVLLTENQMLGRLEVQSNVTTVYIDRQWSTIAAQSTTINKEAVLTPENLAYIIYTSGSTGHPKGVEISHRAVVNLLWSMQHETGYTEDDTLLAITTISFDIAILEIFLPLMSGGRTILVSGAVASDGRQLAKQLQRTKPTVVQATPATWRMLIDAGWQGAAGIKLICGGEKLTRDLADQLLQRSTNVWNVYGPTETTVWSTMAKVYSGKGPVPIGRPIANTQCYVLDQNREPVPIGVPGQLYIGGHGVARGYRNNPELTRDRFLANPFDKGVFYRTGDVVRRLATGDLVFLYRLDNQMKVRGFRIEPGEIETVLREHPLVKDSVVVVHQGVNLIAYVVPLGVEALTSQDIIRWKELHDERVTEWANVWDEIFLGGREVKDPTCNTAGVISSYTGDPIQESQARNWVEQAANRIRSLKPHRLLDIGCGLGRILFRVAPDCTEYWAMDFSKPALDYVAGNLHLLGQHAAQVKLIQGSADDLKSLAGEPFDTVVLNGVVQYFPSIAYFHKVLENIIGRVRSGGHVFLGDLRSLPLLDAFRFSVILNRAADEISQGELREMLVREVIQEKELLIDPLFFNLLKTQIERISNIDVILKRGRQQNELTRFRYDVILHIEADGAVVQSDSDIDWRENKLTLQGIRERLKEKVKTLDIKNIPNYRTLPELIAAAEVLHCRGPESAQGLRTMLDEIRASTIHPEAVWELAEELSYHVHITWSQANGPGYFDACFWRGPVPDETIRSVSISSSFRDRPRQEPLTLYGNNPLKGQLNTLVNPILKRFLGQKLPDYMIPSTFVLLDALSLTPNGKVNRRVLTSPYDILSGSGDAFVPFRNELERTLAKIWCDVLGLEKIGIDDNFFELGGNSLAATRLISRLRHFHSMDISIRTLFEAPTIAELGIAITGSGNQSAGHAKSIR